MRRSSLALFLLTGCLLSADAGAADQPLIGKPAPDFDLTSITGERVGLQGLLGRIVVLHFGAGW